MGPGAPAGGPRRTAGRVVGPSFSVAGTGLFMAAVGLLPGLFGASLHGTVESLHVAHWVLAGLMPFAVGAGASLALRTGPPGQVNGRGPALRTLAIGLLGSLLAEGFFQTVGAYGGAQVTGATAAAIGGGHPDPFTTAQLAAVVGLGFLAALVLARSQWRGALRLRDRPPGG